MVYDARIVADSASIFRFMQSSTFEPSRTVVIETDPGFAMADTTYTTAWTVHFTSYRLNSMALDLTTPKDGFLVFSEIYYPGWNAYIDGTRQTIFRANWNQRVIPVRAGAHTVEMRFESGPFIHGMWITLATLAFCLGGIVVSSVRKEPQQQTD